MVTADEKSGETVRLIKFDGSETAWHEWSIKTLQLAKSKGFRHVYAKDTKPIDDDAYQVSTDDDKKKNKEQKKGLSKSVESSVGRKQV